MMTSLSFGDGNSGNQVGVNFGSLHLHSGTQDLVRHSLSRWNSLISTSASEEQAKMGAARAEDLKDDPLVQSTAT